MQKSHFGFWMSVLMLCALLVTACSCTFSCGPNATTYTLTWNPGVTGFPNVDLTLTPIIPPKALSLKPSDYVQIDLKADGFSFSTNDPAYQCLETVAATTLPILFAPEDEAISGFAAINDFLVVYQACGQFLQTSPIKLASRGGIAAKELIFFQITGQKMVSRAANGQELTPSGPVGGPTPVTPTPIINFKASIQTTSPSTSSEQCSDFKQALPPFTLSLDNTGSNVDVQWTATFRERDPTGTEPWGSGPASGTVGAGDTSNVVITPASDLCNIPANSSNVYHIGISYGEVNQEVPTPLTLTYTVYGVRIT